MFEWESHGWEDTTKSIVRRKNGQLLSLSSALFAIYFVIDRIDKVLDV